MPPHNPATETLAMTGTFVTPVLRKIRNFVDNTRRLGIGEATKLYRYRLSERYHDWKLGIRTTGLIESHELGHDSHCQPYEAIHYQCLNIVMDYFSPDPRRDVMLDYGCGMGRAVVVAATRPFKQVIGVELSADLSRTAIENVEHAKRRRKCPNVVIVTEDATTYTVPPDVTAIFLFNPFTGPILQAVQQRIRESLQATPRDLKLVYMHPSYEPNTFDECRWLTRDQRLSTADWDDVELVAYQANTSHI